MNEPRLLPRQHPIFSPLAIVASLVMLTGLAATLLLTGGRAFSPGALSAVAVTGTQVGGFDSHADFADDCLQCHQPLQGVNTAACLDCHETLGARVEGGTGFHADEAAADCTRCHGEHAGADHDLQAAALATFDREDHAVSYALHGAHLQVDCADCHANDIYLGLAHDCAACHAEPAAHAGVYGVACSNCHAETGWESAGMRVHSFPLDHGVGVDLPCAGCHTNADTFTVHTCNNCHEHDPAAMDAVHAPLRLSAAELADCVGCHAEGTPAETERLRQKRQEG